MQPSTGSITDVILVFLLACGLLVLLFAAMGWLGLRLKAALERRRLRRSLPDDWWPRFEADLRAYMRQMQASAGTPRRRRP